ncbi:MAG: hypothetical protein RML74_12705 [Acidobacteriota bacterium]|nr:hypothetical protein [Acidobacteriota bacterium]
MPERDILLTGVPRSGTTLACWLLNQLPNVLALVEPGMGVRFFVGMMRGDANGMCRSVRRFFEKTRRDISLLGCAPSLHIRGGIPANVMEEYRWGKLRRRVATHGKIRIEKPLPPEFWLVVKHPGTFTAPLERLARDFPTYAIIRNPLAVLASWNSVSLPVNRGYAPMAELFDSSLRRALARIRDRWERQLYLLGWFFEKYWRVLPERAVLRYEDIIATGGRALRAIVPEAAELNVPLQNRNASSLYDASLMRALGERLLKTDGPYWHFYSRESVERLMVEVEQ